MTNLEEPNDSNMGNCCLVALAKETAGLKGGNSMFRCSALKTVPQFSYPCFFFSYHLSLRYIRGLEPVHEIAKFLNCSL